MARDTITLILGGEEVSLALYAEALRDFTRLLRALSEEIAGTAEIEWEVAQVTRGSLGTTVRGVYEDVRVLEEIGASYVATGRAIQTGSPIPFTSPEIVESVRALVSLTERVPSLTFGSNGDSATLEGPVADLVTHAEVGRDSLISFGELRGTVATIWDRPQLRFALYDDLFERVVYCYLDKDQAELAREVWRRRVAVAGIIYREPETGRPTAVRNVRNIQVLEKVSASLERVRGLLGWEDGDEPAELSIRRLRDGLY